MKRQRAIAPISTALLCGVLLTGCGSDVPEFDFDALEDSSESQQSTDPDPGQDDPALAEPAPIEFLLPETSDTPSGFHQIPARCDTSSDANEYRGWYGFAVPEGWEANGRTGGSTSPLDDGTTVSFGSGSIRSSVEAQSDSIDGDGSIGDGQGGKWATFDYDYKIGDSSVTVRYDEVGTVSIAGQDIAIMAAPYQQAPDRLKVTEYKARIEAAHVYGRFYDGTVYPASFVVTIKPTTDDKELSEEIVRGIVGSFTMPECAKKLVIVTEEATTQKDADGDGQVATPDDYRELLTELSTAG